MKLTVCEVDGHQIQLTRYSGSKKRLFLEGCDLIDTSCPSVRIPTNLGFVVAVLQPGLLRFREMSSLPDLGASKLRNILPIELRSTIIGNPEDFQFAVVKAEAGTALASWIPKASVETTLHFLRGLGLEPNAVTANILHLPLLAGAGFTGVLTDGVQVAVVRDGAPRYLGSLAPENAFEHVKALMRGKNRPDATQAPISVHLFGDDTDRVAQVVSSELSPCSLVFAVPDDVGIATFGGDHDLFLRHAASYATAVAASSGNLVDFLYGEFIAGPVVAALKKQRFILKTLLCLLSLLLLADAGWRYRNAASHLASINDRISGVYHELYPRNKKAVDEVSEVKSELKSLAGVGSALDPLEVMRLLSTAKQPGIIGIHDCDIDASRMIIKGTAKSSPDVAAFKGRVADIFKDVRVTEENTGPQGVTFTIQAVIADGGRI